MAVQKALRLVKVILSAHATLCLRTAKAVLSVVEYLGSASVLTSTAGSWPTAIPIRYVCIIEVVEVIEHEVHVLLLVMLQMVYDALILVYLNSYVRISLARDGARLYEAAVWPILVLMRKLPASSWLLLCVAHVIATLSCRHIAHDAVAAVVQLLLTTTHGLVVKLARLLLQLVVADVECVTTEAVVATTTATHLTVAAGVAAAIVKLV